MSSICGMKSLRCLMGISGDIGVLKADGSVGVYTGETGAGDAVLLKISTGHDVTPSK